MIYKASKRTYYLGLHVHCLYTTLRVHHIHYHHNTPLKKTPQIRIPVEQVFFPCLSFNAVILECGNHIWIGKICAMMHIYVFECEHVTRIRVSFHCQEIRKEYKSFIQLLCMKESGFDYKEQ
ncbi:hypothetical protein V6Z11_D10G150500 [Gossypium hirsutum]